MVSTRLQSGCASGPAGSSSANSPPHASCTEFPAPPTGFAGNSATSVIVSTGSLFGSGGTLPAKSTEIAKSLPPNQLSKSLSPNATNQVATLSGAVASSSSAKAVVTSGLTLGSAPIHLMQFPTELLEKILLYLDFKTISSLRLVNRRMNIVCGSVLSTTFNRLQSTMLARFQAIKAKMPRRESARRQHPLACESDIVEMLHMRLALLQMSFGKHIERQHCCFFAGEILDEIYRIILYIKTTPRLARPYKVTDELFDLSTMAMEYFKEKIEPTLPEITYFGSDFIDIAPFPSSKNDSIACGSESGGCGFESTLELSPRSPPQSNMVLRKRIHKIKQGMKRYSSQLTLMKRELKLCKVKLVDQNKTVVDYATRLDEYDKKNEETSRKFSSVLQELNKCKTELQFFRSKLPFNLNPDCSTCTGPLVANGAPQVAPDFNQVLSPQAMHIPPGGGSLDELLLAGPTLESADPGLQVAAVPLAGSASPRATEEESGPSGVQAEAPVSTGKKQGRSRQAQHSEPASTTQLAGGEGETEQAETAVKKPGPGRPRSHYRGGAQVTTHVSANSEDSSSGGSDHEFNTPTPTLTRKAHSRSVGNDPCASTSSQEPSTWSVRTKKRKLSSLSNAASNVLTSNANSGAGAVSASETKVLRGTSTATATVAAGSGLNGGVCKRSRR
uniref:F-box only protein 28 n=1 Tax=Cacopsylla melanoneura TaxID=428564 RepID=A0A8D8LIP0_9HEMI